MASAADLPAKIIPTKIAWLRLYSNNNNSNDNINVNTNTNTSTDTYELQKSRWGRGRPGDELVALEAELAGRVLSGIRKWRFTPNPPTEIVDLGGFDSSIILI